jgi:hypothetical protein
VRVLMLVWFKREMQGKSEDRKRPFDPTLWRRCELVRCERI